MPANQSALLSVSRVGALGVGLFYGMINSGVVNKRAAEDRKKYGPHAHHDEPSGAAGTEAVSKNAVPGVEAH